MKQARGHSRMVLEFHDREGCESAIEFQWNKKVRRRDSERSTLWKVSHERKIVSKES